MKPLSEPLSDEQNLITGSFGAQHLPVPFADYDGDMDEGSDEGSDDDAGSEDSDSTVRAGDGVGAQGGRAYPDIAPQGRLLLSIRTLLSTTTTPLIMLQIWTIPQKSFQTTEKPETAEMWEKKPHTWNLRRKRIRKKYFQMGLTLTQIRVPMRIFGEMGGSALATGRMRWVERHCSHDEVDMEAHWTLFLGMTSMQRLEAV